MNWNYLKTNWFYFAMGILLLLYAVRKYPNLNPFSAPNRGNQKEKITDDKNAKTTGAALLGFVTEAPKPQGATTEDVDAAKAEAFLKRFAAVAHSERKKFGIPASVILACAYVNSNAGQNEVSLKANNFFALPCTDEWEGETIKVKGNCVRRYETAWASFRDFSIFLSSQEWFGSLKKSGDKNGLKWAEKLGAEGLANASAMKKVIEEFDLQELDVK
jgi:flagellum-specific peptidoglycan hydrolase FlgJ